ncbi:hypothetical protein ACFYPN_00010 [Streptomyces sp. NPDC005576]|uniref:hypothetical protein n=1 Tax=unclassified Streptomyces TaxID=2593676 RepID=UPI0033D928AB
MTDHLKDPQVVSWKDLAEEFSFTDAEKDRIQKGAQALVLASRVHSDAVVESEARSSHCNRHYLV